MPFFVERIHTAQRSGSLVLYALAAAARKERGDDDDVEEEEEEEEDDDGRPRADCFDDIATRGRLLG